MTTTTDPALRFELRPYQREAIDRMRAAQGRGVSRQLGVAATGLGKTVMFCALAHEMRARTLILAHRDELIEQAAGKVREVWPGADVGVVKAERDEVHGEVVVASVQTLARSRRLARLVDAQASQLLGERPFRLVIVDEAHHTAADSYRRILDGLGVGTADGPLCLGVTATPDRGDGKGLNDLFDEIVWNYDILWGIRSGYLSDVKGKRVGIEGFDLGGVRVTHGDFDQGQAGDGMMQAGAPEQIVTAWRSWATGRRTLVFTPTVAMAQAVADKFRLAGIAAGWVSGATPMDERRETLAAFRDGRLDVLSNCAVLTEGYDEPRVDCIVVARPTRSRALYTQMIGRGTRRHPDKDHLLVLDVVGASAEHSLITIPSLFGIERKGREEDDERTVTEAIDQQEREQIRLGNIVAADVELFHQMRSQGLAWVKVHAAGTIGWYTIGLGGEQRERVTLRQAALGEDSWSAFIEWEQEDGSVKRRPLMMDVTLETAQGVGEDYVRKMGGGTVALTSVDAPWRKRKPTERQLWAAARWKMPVDPSWNAGQLSEALDAHIARKKAAQRPKRH